MSTLKSIGGVIQGVANTVGSAVPGFSGAATVAMAIVNMVDQTDANNANLKNICSTIADIMNKICCEWEMSTKRGQELSSTVLSSIDTFKTTLDKIHEKYKKLKEQGRFKRFIYTWKNMGVIADMTWELNNARDLFKEVLLVNIAQVTESLGEMMSNNMSQGPVAEIEAHGNDALVSGVANVKTTNHIRSTETPWINQPARTRINVSGKGVQVKSSGNVTTTNYVGF